MTVHIEDGRSFLHDTERRYDLVLYAIPDSLTVLAGQSSLRLESYLLTREAMQEVHEHLKPGRRRLDVPLLPAGGGGPIRGRPDPGVRRSAVPRARAGCRAAAADGPDGEHAARRSGVRPAMVAAGELPAPVTDDHPFAYLVGHGIPSFYLATLLAILLGSLVAVRVTAGPFGQMRPYVDLFFMGAAFLLLETSNVVRFALLFGTTWFVNALVFAGILVSVYLAIEVARRVRFRHPAWLYVPLFVSVAIAWAVPLEALLGLDFVPRFAAAVALGFTPVFIANLVFADRFRDVGASGVAFGTNLLGAIVGGVLEYGALVIGYRALLIVVAAVYGLAFVDGAVASRRAGPAGRRRRGAARRARPRRRARAASAAAGPAGTSARPRRIATASSPRPQTLPRNQSHPPTNGIRASSRRMTQPPRNATYRDCVELSTPAPQPDRRDDVAEGVEEREREQGEDAEGDAHHGDRGAAPEPIGRRKKSPKPQPIDEPDVREPPRPGPSGTHAARTRAAACRGSGPRPSSRATRRCVRRSRP